MPGAASARAAARRTTPSSSVAPTRLPQLASGSPAQGGFRGATETTTALKAYLATATSFYMVELWDIAGRFITRHDVGWQGAGEHSDALGDRTFRVRPGIYLVRLQQGGHSITKRVSVMP